MTISEELSDLAKYLASAEGDSAAMVCERAREVIEELMNACDSWDRGFIEGEEFTPEQFRVWVNQRRQFCRDAFASAKADR